MVSALFEDIARTSTPLSRHVVRCVPLQITCFAGIDEVVAAIAPLLEANFGPDQPARSFKILINRRNNESVRKLTNLLHFFFSLPS